MARSDLIAAIAATLLAAAGAANADGVGYSSLSPEAKAALMNPAGAAVRAGEPSVVAAVVNVEGVPSGRLKLTAQALADIYLGNITHWDAPQIASLNPGVTLPHRPITVVHRSDPSGASQAFTGFLSAQSATFRNEVGVSPTASFPVGVGRAGDAGVAEVVAKTPDSIGYVDFGFAQSSGLSTARLIDGRTMPIRAMTAPKAAAPPMAEPPKPASLYNPR